MDDEHDKMVDTGTIKGQEGHWIKVHKKEKKLPSFKEWLKESKGIKDIIRFGSSSHGVQVLNRWHQEYEHLKGHVERLKKVI